MEYSILLYLNDNQSKMIYHTNSSPSSENHCDFYIKENSLSQNCDSSISIELYKPNVCFSTTPERLLLGETKVPISFLLKTDEKYIIIEIRRSDDLLNVTNVTNINANSTSILFKLDIKNHHPNNTKRSLRRKLRHSQVQPPPQAPESPHIKRSLSLQRKSSLIRQKNPDGSNNFECLSPGDVKKSTFEILSFPLNPLQSTATLSEEPTALFASSASNKSVSMPENRPSSPLMEKLNLLSTPHPIIEDSMSCLLLNRSNGVINGDGDGCGSGSGTIIDDTLGMSPPQLERVNASSVLALQSPQINESILLNPSLIKGLVSLEIVGASNLPFERRFLRLKNTTNPFCVVSFGKQTFRTKVQRANQNPFWRERLFFTINRHEVNYSIRFSIYDHSKISYNSKIGSNHINLSTLLDNPNHIKKIEVPILGISGNDNFSNNNRVSLRDNASDSCDSDCSDSDDGSISDGSDDQKVQITEKVKEKKVQTSSIKASLLLKACFISYDELRRNFWELLAQQYDHDDNGKLNRIELTAMLDCIGCTLSESSLDTILIKMEVKPDLVGEIDIKTIVEALEVLATSGTGNISENIVHMDHCPICSLDFKKLHFNFDIDIITHMSICAAKDSSKVNRFIMGGFLTENYASMKWFSKLLSWITFGNYNIGRNNGIILVQDRCSGRLMEEKIPSYIRFSIRILHQYSSKETARMLKHLFSTMTIKQGRAYDSPGSANNIADFVKYHHIPLDEVLRPLKSFTTFNDFFYRKLKPNSRSLHSPNNPEIIISPADSRLHCFPSISESTRLWIKGSNFSIPNLLGSDVIASMFPAKSSVCIARLAPQDYHRFHSPVDGKIVRSYHIPGSYYTVNPMAVRQKLDVYTENARTILLIESPQHGLVAYVAVGAMMVGSILMTRAAFNGGSGGSEDDSSITKYPIRSDLREGMVKMSPESSSDPNISRMDELGYFAFGGSTIVMLFQPECKFDSDLLANSRDQLETLIKVGDRIGYKNK